MRHWRSSSVVLAAVMALCCKAEPKLESESELVPPPQHELEAPPFALAVLDRKVAPYPGPVPLRVRIRPSRVSFDTKEWQRWLDPDFDFPPRSPQVWVRKPRPSEAAALRRKIASFDREQVSNAELLALVHEADQAFMEFSPRVARTYPGGLQLEVEANVEPRVVFDILAIAEQAGIGRFQSLVEGRDIATNERGARGFETTYASTLHAPHGSASHLRLSMVVSKDGVYLYHEPGNPEHPPEGVTQYCRERTLVLGPNRSCPTLPFVDGHIDVAQLHELLDDLDYAKYHSVLHLGAAPGATWVQVLEIVASVQQLNVGILSSLVPEIAGGTDCSTGVLASELCVAEPTPPA